ncbi:hypothetical protein NDU88_005096 [Pleurodeles waltl]|uniref:Uncharacterized protein n=1 Tax=Pleurodeles waltl TaxID=8319 RepID=A0AAV7PEY7_PLEWA|nr:hypothetical protein NDU88_005096 [Pleurodeles waltl]
MSQGRLESILSQSGARAGAEAVGLTEQKGERVEEEGKKLSAGSLLPPAEVLEHETSILFPVSRTQDVWPGRRKTR